jgi:hypothetical protein
MKKIIAVYILLILAFLLLTSCKSVYPIKSSELTPLKKDFSNAYKDYNLTIDSISLLLKLFDVDAVSPKRTVNVQMLDENHLRLTYQNNLDVSEAKIFKGKLKKSGFKIFVKKDRWFILPILWKTEVKRLKLNLDKNDDLVINEYCNNSAMFLFMAAGTSWEEQHLFKKAG